MSQEGGGVVSEKRFIGAVSVFWVVIRFCETLKFQMGWRTYSFPLPRVLRM